MKKIVTSLIASLLFLVIVCGLASCFSSSCVHYDSDGNGICDRCKDTMQIHLLNEINYRRSHDGTYYTVTGIKIWSDENLVIPEEYAGLPVRNIGDGAFAGCENIRNITIPNNVTKIGARAFYGVEKLYLYKLPTNLQTVDSNCFNGAGQNVHITKLPDNLKTIETGAFQGCNICVESFGSKNNELGSKLESIGSSAFSGGGQDIKIIYIFDSVVKLSRLAFQNYGVGGKVTAYTSFKEAPEGWYRLDGNLDVGLNDIDYEYSGGYPNDET